LADLHRVEEALRERRDTHLQVLRSLQVQYKQIVAEEAEVRQNRPVLSNKAKDQADALLAKWVPLNNSILSATSPGKFYASLKAHIWKKKTKTVMINYMFAEAQNNLPSNYPLLAPVLAAESLCPTHFSPAELEHVVQRVKEKHSTPMSKVCNKKAYKDVQKYTKRQDQKDQKAKQDQKENQKDKKAKQDQEEKKAKRQQQKEEEKQQLLVRKAYVDSLNLANTPDAFLTSQQRDKKREILELADRAEQIAEDPEFRPSVRAIDTVNCKVSKREVKPPEFFRESNTLIA
jgi:ribosomal protein L14E/L6E/L27E